MKPSGSASVLTGARFHEMQRERLQRLRALARLLDSCIPLPGGFRVGLDALIGLVPVVGDVAGALLSGYIVNEARLLGAPGSVLLRMSMNLLIETVVGAVPLVGDLFDAGFKANLRNIALLERYHLDPQGSRSESRWIVAAAGLVIASVAAAVLAIPVLLIVWLVS